MRLIGVILTIICFCVLLTVAVAGGDYKAYQDRNLTNTLEIQRSDLSEEAIAHLVDLPRAVQTNKSVGDSVFIDDAEWFLLNDQETIGVHFMGCRGSVIFNLEESTKK